MEVKFLSELVNFIAFIVSNFIGYGLNLRLVKIFKVIKCPKFHWIGTKPHDKLENVLDKKTTLICTWKVMKNYKGLVCFMFQISTVGIVK